MPKKMSVFIFQVDCWKVTLHGDKLTSRNLGLWSWYSSLHPRWIFFFFFIIWDFATIYLAIVFLLRFLGMNMVKVCYLLVAHPRFSISLRKFHVSLCIMFNILKPLWASERILRYIYIYKGSFLYSASTGLQVPNSKWAKCLNWKFLWLIYSVGCLNMIISMCWCVILLDHGSV